MAKKDYKELKNRVQQSDKKNRCDVSTNAWKRNKETQSNSWGAKCLQRKDKTLPKISMTHKTASKQYKMKMDTKKDYKGMQND